MEELLPLTVLHVDMDAFFAAIEQRDDPRLRGKPVVVGSQPNARGVVATASYEARTYGIHSAMPSREAGRLCPHAHFLPGRHERYAEVSRELMEILRRFTPVVEPVSIDEAFLDISGVSAKWESSRDLAKALMKTIQRDLGLTASVGVAVNKFLAKLASDFEKPNGLTVTPQSRPEIIAFLAPLPIRLIWGVGAKTEKVLLRYGFRTIEQVQVATKETLASILGMSSGQQIWRLAQGEDERPVSAQRPDEKSISREHTFPVDCREISAVKQTLIELTEDVGQRLRAAGRVAGVAVVKIRFPDFRTVTRRLTIRGSTDSDRQLLRHAFDLLEQLPPPSAVRLIGFGVTALTEPGTNSSQRQMLLFDDDDDPVSRREGELDRAVDALRKRYGRRILTRGRSGRPPPRS